jgi:peroxiredoxin
MIPLGSTGPDFTLPDTISGTEKSLSELKSDTATVIMFICNHCPFVIHLLEGIQLLATDYLPKGIRIIAISSNNVETYPQDSPEKMKELADEQGWEFPYLYDESQDVAKAYQAACTPDFYIFDSELACVYRGQFDDSRPSNGQPVTGRDIRAALDSILAGIPVSEDQKVSQGCNIKWK